MSGYFQKIDELERINKQESELGALKTKISSPNADGYIAYSDDNQMD